MSPKQLIPLLLLSCLIFSQVGCKRTKIPGLKPAEGVVLYDNVPLAWATIGFIPKDSSKGRQAATQTDGEGRFTLRTLGDPGALPGEYRVMVHREIQDQGKNSLANWKRDRASGNPDPKPDPDLRSSPNVKFIPAIPKKYFKPQSSAIEITIPPEGDSNIKIDLPG